MGAVTCTFGATAKYVLSVRARGARAAGGGQCPPYELDAGLDRAGLLELEPVAGGVLGHDVADAGGEAFFPAVGVVEV